MKENTIRLCAAGLIAWTGASLNTTLVAGGKAGYQFLLLAGAEMS